MARITSTEAQELHELLLIHGTNLEKAAFFEDICHDSELNRILGKFVREEREHYDELLSFAEGQSTAGFDHGGPSFGNRQYGGRHPNETMRPTSTVRELSDRTIAADMLISCKTTATCAVKAATECSSSSLRRTLMDLSREHLDAAYEMYRFMESRGWYAQPRNATQDTGWVRRSYADTEPGYREREMIGSRAYNGDARDMRS